MTVTVEGAKRWDPRVADAGAELLLTGTCPTCGRRLVHNVQPPPWSAPAADEFDEDGNVDEQRRRAGSVRHEDTATLTMQLWCHPCGKGTDVELSEG